MKLLEDRIRRDGVVKEGNVLKVDRFLNHQMDIELFQEIGKEFKRRFANENVNKILTIEGFRNRNRLYRGRIFSCAGSLRKEDPDKKHCRRGLHHSGGVLYHGRIYDIIVSKEFLGKGDRVLLIDDFLANGKALEGLAQLVQDSGAELVGAGVVIEKGFQRGGDAIRAKGIHLESLAIVESMNDKTGEIVFREQ